MPNEYELVPAWALKKIKTLASVYAVNLTPEALEVWVKQIIKIVGRNDWDEPSPTSSDSRKAIGRVRPGEWLFEYWASNHEWFPKPVQLRRIYGRYWPPADGVEVAEEEA